MLKNQREQMRLINCTQLTLIKANFFSTFIFCFYYLKHEDIFKEPTYVPKKEESVFNQNVL